MDQIRATILAYFDIPDYSSLMMFSNRWGFDYNENYNINIGESIW